MISFAITTHNEGKNIGKLIDRLNDYKLNSDEIIVLDDFSTDEVTLHQIQKADKVFKRKFKKDYAEHKNILNSKCSCDYIFQLDADELPSCLLLSKIHNIIKKNKSDLIAFPRVNVITGITATELRNRGWNVDKFNRINYPDYQGRCYINADHIKWERPLHEYIVGAKSTHFVEPNKKLDIVHVKTREKHDQSNLLYNKNYTKDYQLK